MRSLMIITCLILLVSSCHLLESTNGGSKIKPPTAFVSPNMDFTKIDRIGVFPLFMGGQAGTSAYRDEQFEGELTAALASNIQRHQSQWKFTSHRDMLITINREGLARGYKNLQADFNTYAGLQGTPMVYSSATKEFFKKLSAATGINAFVFGSYVLTEKLRMVKTFYGVSTWKVLSCIVRVTLYYVNDECNWWWAQCERYGQRNAVIKEIAESLGSYVGKGTLRQM